MLLEKEAIQLIAQKVDGDARMALNLVEACVIAAKKTEKKSVTVSLVHATMNNRFVKYDKHDEEHYNIISALHKSIVHLLLAIECSEEVTFRRLFTGWQEC